MIGTALPAVTDHRPAAARIARGWRPPAALKMLGPAFVASVAYVDPGNFATNFAAGSAHGYELVWVVVLANAMAILVQYAASKIGLVTHQSLPALCRHRFGRRANTILWLQAEVVAMATDLAEVVGAAIGLNLVFGMPMFTAGLVTAVVAFGILLLRRRGHRQFELAIVAFLALVATGCLFVLLDIGRTNYSSAARGLLPRLSGGDSLGLAVGIIGATIMPHAIYLHSALQTNRDPSSNRSARRTTLRVNTLDCVMALGIAGLVNLSMLFIAASLAHGRDLGQFEGLATVHARLQSLVGGGAALAFGVALMASGLCSSSVGTQAGEVVMAGFLNWHIPLIVRRAVTLAPALIVLALSADPGRALLYSQLVLAAGIPFALLQLTMITRDAGVMRDMVNRASTTVLLAGVTAVVCVLNLVLVVQYLWEYCW